MVGPVESMTTPNNDSLLRTPPDKYGDAYQHHLLDQYTLYVETADRVSQRRTSANNHLLTVNVFLVSFYGRMRPRRRLPCNDNRSAPCLMWQGQTHSRGT